MSDTLVLYEARSASTSADLRWRGVAVRIGIHIKHSGTWWPR